MFDEEKLTGWSLPAEWSPQPVTGLPEAVRVCRRIADTMNAESFSLQFLSPQGESRRLAPVFDSDFPGVSFLSKALSAREAGAFARQIAQSTVPLWWRPAGGSPFPSAGARCWADEIENPTESDTCGIAFPVSLEHGRSGVIAFAGDRIVIDEVGLCDVHARCFALFGEVAKQRLEDCAKALPVSKREIECLRLTASGMTSEDIASSLGLSVHTANQYLTNSTHKLNAVNRIHAVAKALRSGLID